MGYWAERSAQIGRGNDDGAVWAASGSVENAEPEAVGMSYAHAARRSCRLSWVYSINSMALPSGSVIQACSE